MIAEPPFDAGATQVRRIWPARPVATAATERGAAGDELDVDGALAATLLDGVDGSVDAVGALSASG